MLPKPLRKLRDWLRPRQLTKTQLMNEYQRDIRRISGATSVRLREVTFQQQIELLNNPRMIQHIEVVEYGVQLPKARRWNALWFVVFLSLLYYHERILPTPIVERYLSVSQQIDKHPVGYIGGGLTMAKPTFFLYLPMVLTVGSHSTRYLKYYMPLLLVSLAVNGFIARELLIRQLDQLEVWNRKKIHYGEGFLFSIGYALWAYLGLKNGLGAGFQSRVFLFTKAGIGIISGGIPIGYIMLAYTAYEIYRTANRQIDGAPSEIVLSSVVIGILYGVLLKRLSR